MQVSVLNAKKILIRKNEDYGRITTLKSNDVLHEGRRGGGDSERARTSNLQLRRLSLYPIELRSHRPALYHGCCTLASRALDSITAEKNRYGNDST